jgi:dTDP-glucose 4,6-dehydratase
MTILVTGCAGFIGAHFVREWLAVERDPVAGLDRLSYAGNLDSLFEAGSDPRFVFTRGDIGDIALVTTLLRRHRPRAIVNFAAETHVDRSIHDAAPFVENNVAALFRLLEAVRPWWQALADADRAAFRFVQISTDEVFGSLAPRDPPFDETSRYAPSSPYSASKAGGDHLVHAWHRTFGLPALIVHLSNAYGPAQFPEKLIPLSILNAAAGRALPLYGDGTNVRDWLFVADACAAIRAVLRGGRPGEAYCAGGSNERSNRDVMEAICAILDRRVPRADGGAHRDLVRHVADRPGHDRRYALSNAKISRAIGWRPETAFGAGLEATVAWYLANAAWADAARAGSYRDWIERNYARRGTA